jgi:hypothetical protein
MAFRSPVLQRCFLYIGFTALNLCLSISEICQFYRYHSQHWKISVMVKRVAPIISPGKQKETDKLLRKILLVEGRPMKLRCRLFGHKYISSVVSTTPFEWENKYCARCKNWRSNFPSDWGDGIIPNLTKRLKNIRITFTGLFYKGKGHH